MRARSKPDPLPNRRRQLAALRRESARALDELIDRRLALEPGKRTHFLRVRRRLAPGSYL